MRTTKLVICLIFGLLLAPYSSAQNYIEYLYNAQKQFTAGEYVNARKSITIYHEMIGKETERDFADKISSCIDYIHKAEDAKKKQLYTSAIEFYKLVQGINPNDSKVTGEISLLQTLISQQEKNDDSSNSSGPYSISERERRIRAEGYVDLGLPSGTCWKSKNESEGYITHSDAMRLYGSNVPSTKQVQELISKCTWSWTGHGYLVTGPNGNSIYLPAMGAHYSDGSKARVGNRGHYWTTDLHWDLRFFPSGEHKLSFHTEYSKKKFDKYSLRLVKVFE